MTTYCAIQDLDAALDSFVARYYGTYLDDGEELTLGTQFNIDQELSFRQVNDILNGIGHIKRIPIGTQSDGNFPYHVRMLQSNLMIYNRLIGKHHGEVTDEIPGWIRVYKTIAKDIETDIKGQNVVFDEDVTQGEQGIGVGSFVSKTGAANLFTNWETGIYTFDGYKKHYVVKIDGTSNGNVVGSSTFKWSDNGGYTFATTGVTTGTAWIGLEHGLQIRWEPVGTLHCGFGDEFHVQCIPMNIPVKSGNIRHVVFKRG